MLLEILKIVLIILLNKTYANITQDSEIILLPSWNSTGAEEISLTLKVFGKLVQLNLRKSDEIISPMFDVWKHGAKGVTKMLSQLETLDSFFYLHENRISFAIIHFCRENELEGFIFLENDILEIRPLRNEFAALFLNDYVCIREQVNLSFGKPYLIKTSLQYFADLNLYHWNNFKSKRRHTRHVQSTERKLTIELAVFFDEAAYHTFMPLLDNDKEKIRCMILLFVNCLQAAYHHPSLGVSIDISLVRLDIMEKQPLDLAVINMDYLELRNTFCDYAYSLNTPDDEDPRHWDLALYLTGLDLYKYLNRPVGNYTKDYNTMGISSGTLCEPYASFSCSVAEFHAAPENLSPVLKSSFIAVHEIAHNLGMSHDIYKSNEKKYIMSPYDVYQRPTEWSPESYLKIRELWERKECLRDGSKYLNNDDLPGREWTAKAQCEVLLFDKDANVVTLHDICQSLQCEIPNNKTNYFMGPALDGTYCALGKECRSAECVPVIEPPYVFKYCDFEYDNWSEWKKDFCKSDCLTNSKGIEIKRRFCEHQTHRTANCIGPYYDVVLCDDSTLCPNRTTVAEYTNVRCEQFSRIVYKQKMKPGWQAPHEVDKPWKACTIFCMREGSYYEPRLEMLNYGIDPYFPDGTWCHKKDDQDYYCRQHHCLPQNYSFEQK